MAVRKKPPKPGTIQAMVEAWCKEEHAPDITQERAAAQLGIAQGTFQAALNRAGFKWSDITGLKSKSDEIRAYAAEHPSVRFADIARAVGVHPRRVQVTLRVKDPRPPPVVDSMLDMMSTDGDPTEGADAQEIAP